MTVQAAAASTGCPRRSRPAIAARRISPFRCRDVRNDMPGAPIAARPQAAGKTRAVRRATARTASKISASRVRRGSRRTHGANHPRHRFARVRSRIRSRARFRDALVKKIFNSPESSLCDRSRAHRGEKISRRARAPAFEPRIATARKPLCHADFCVTRRNAPLLSSLHPEKSCAR